MSKGMRGGFSRSSHGSRPAGMNSGNMQQMLRQAQMMQAEMQKEQEDIEGTTFVGTAGGEAVKVTVKGDRNVESVEIKPEVVDPEDVEMLQDLIVAAVNDAMKQINDCSEERLGKYTAGLQ